MKKIKIGICGATGRMGQMLTRLLRDETIYQDRFDLVYQSSGPDDQPFESLSKSKAEVVIDFSVPEASLEMARLCAKLGIAHLVCTTGFDGAELKTLHQTHRQSTWALVPNTSQGIFALGEALKRIFEFLPGYFSVSIVEVHHAQKKDAPSGTAKMLETIVREHFQGKQEVPVLSIRAGSDPGEHRVLIMGPSERLEFSHRAENRDLFARGALALVEKLRKKKKRKLPYTLAELLTEKK